MDTNWILVIVLWGGLVGVIIACFFPEFRKTPDQRKAEVQKARERAIKKREEKKKSRQEAKNNAPAKGCLQSSVEFGFVSIFLIIAVIICIMLLIVSGK